MFFSWMRELPLRMQTSSFIQRSKFKEFYELLNVPPLKHNKPHGIYSSEKYIQIGFSLFLFPFICKLVRIIQKHAIPDKNKDEKKNESKERSFILLYFYSSFLFYICKDGREFGAATRIASTLDMV